MDIIKKVLGFILLIILITVGSVILVGKWVNSYEPDSNKRGTDRYVMEDRTYNTTAYSFRNERH